jgi:Interleukin-like EMT inducer
LTECVVNALAWGYFDTNTYNGYINVTRNTTSTKTAKKRGFNIVELDVSKCSISDVRNFNTSNSLINSMNMASYINSLPTSTVLIGVTAGEASHMLEINGRKALLSIGVDVTGLQILGKVAFVAQVGRPALTVMRMGPLGGDNVKITVNVRGNVNI